MRILNKLTLAQLKENKKRTFLTGLSITMIVSLLTAIVMFLSSMWVFMHDSIINSLGDWHFKTDIVSKQQVDELKLSKFIDSVTVIPNSTVTVSSQEINNFNSIDLTTIAIDDLNKLKSSLGYMGNGTWPVNDTEVALPYNLVHENSVKNVIGKQVTLTVGNVTKTYTISGLYYIEDNKSAYVVTKTNDFPSHNYTVFAKSNELNSNYFKVIENYSKQSGITIEKHNTVLLGLYLITPYEHFDVLIKNILPVIVILVGVISIIVISSSFSLSLNERLKQLGALSSIGTTRGQLIKMMFLESAWIGTVSIILGLIIGYIGMAISLSFIDNYVQQLSTMLGGVHFKVVIFWPSVAFVVVVSAILIALSAILPSIRASRRTPIDNIKQVPFSKIFKFRRKGKKIRRPWMTKLFGHPAFLANRYQKYYSSRSRIIFIVLSISLITFNVISSLLFVATRQLEQRVNYGYVHNINSASELTVTQYGFENVVREDVENYVKTLNGLKRVYTVTTKDVVVTQPQLLDIIKLGPHSTRTHRDDSVDHMIKIAKLSSSEETELLEKSKISKEEFKTKGILVSDDYNMKKVSIPASPEGKFKNVSILENSDDEKNIVIATNIHADKLSFNLPDYMVLFVSDETFSRLDNNSQFDNFKFVVLDVLKDKRQEFINDLRDFVETSAPYAYVNDIKGARQSVYSVLGIIQILVYGFLSLISIICLTTFFNTISANVDLRQREIAMLKSIGMTQKQVRKMLSIEHLKTGIYSLLFAIVVSWGILQFIAGRISRSTEISIPLSPTIISSVVFLTILILFNLLTMRQALKRSIVESIKDETL